jgi:hypothetical protein
MTLAHYLLSSGMVGAMGLATQPPFQGLFQLPHLQQQQQQQQQQIMSVA